jgi:hypothetical protein
MQYTVPYNGPRFLLLDSQWFWPESRWNILATFDKLCWKAKVFDPNNTVLFDSSTAGPVEFKLQPAANFNQLFVCDEAPPGEAFVRDRANRYGDPKLAEITRTLEALIDAHLIQASRHEKADDATQMTDEEIEHLRALGYF